MVQIGTENEDQGFIQWEAVYDDDTILEQFAEDGTENAYGHIDRDRLSEFRVLNRQTGALVLVLSLDEGARLVFRRRNFVDGISGELNNVIYLVGWQKTVGGENVQSLNWILRDGTIINTGKFTENHVFLGDIILLPFEKEDYVFNTIE